MVPTRTEAIARPGILGFVASHSNEEVAQLVRTGQLDRGMPRFDFNDEEMRALQTYLRGLIAGTMPPQAGRGGGGRGGVPRFQPHPAYVATRGWPHAVRDPDQ